MPKKIAIWALIAFLVFYLVTQPQGASDIVSGIAGGIAGGFEGLGRFLNGLS